MKPPTSVAEELYALGFVESDVDVFLRDERPLVGLRGVITFVACPLAHAILAWHQIDGCVRSDVAIGSEDGPACFHLLTTHVAATEQAIGGLYPYTLSARGRPRSARHRVAAEIARLRAQEPGHVVVALVGGKTVSSMFPARCA